MLFVQFLQFWAHFCFADTAEFVKQQAAPSKYFRHWFIDHTIDVLFKLPID